jgi:transposase
MPLARVLFVDETDLLLFPPLRAGWAMRGQAKHVALSGRNAKCVLFGAVDALSGQVFLLARQRQRAEDFCAFLRYLRACHQQQVLVLVLDEDSSHTAHRSKTLADELGIILLFLPKRSPHLNPVDHLWRAVKQQICANHQYEDLEDQVYQVANYLHSLPPQEILTKAGICSPGFWVGCLRPPLCKNFSGPT